MQYKTLLDYGTVDRIKSEMPQLEPGIWLVDLDPNCDKVLIGPFDSIAQAHDNRDFIWHYGDRFGRYLWVVMPQSLDKIRGRIDFIQHIELGIDTLPLEVTGMKLKIQGVKDWVSIPRRRAIK